MNFKVTSNFLLFTVIALFLTACSTDEVRPKSGESNCKLLESKDSDGRVTKFEYNAKGLLSKIIYINDQDIEAGTEYTAYTYDSSGRLIKTEEYRGKEVEEHITFEYTNDLIDRRKLYWRNQLRSTETLFYDSEKKLIRVEGNNDYDSYIITITYNSVGNVLNKILTDRDGTFSLLYEEYDDKIAPYNHVLEVANPSIHTKLSKNNPRRIIAVTHLKNEEPGLFIRDYTYKYNSDNLPVTITETYPEEGAAAHVYVTDLAYKCE